MRSVRGQSLADVFEAVGGRGPGFDTLRLLAASAVVYHHASARDHDIVHDAIFALSHGYTQLGLLAVSVFFTLSGFLVTPGLVRSGNVVDYLSRRFMRIMPLLCVMVTACAFVVGPAITSAPLRAYFSDPLTWMYLKNVTTSLSLTLPGIVNEVGSAKLNTPMWTLRFEWLCYFALAGASLTGLLRHRFMFLAVYVLLQAAVLLHYGFVPTDEGQSLFYVLVFLFSYFGAGTLLFLFREWIPVSKRWVTLVAGVLALGFYTGIGPVVAPLCIAYLVTTLGLVRFPWSDLLAKADLSYGVYLTHHVILTILVTLYPFQSGALLFAAALPLSFLIAWMTWTLIEKPALRHKDLPARVFYWIFSKSKPLQDRRERLKEPS